MNIKNIAFSFHGRINRMTFLIVSVLLYLWGLVFNEWFGPIVPEMEMTAGTAVIMLVNFILVIWIMLAIQTKRLHDTNRSGLWLLLHLLPLLGNLILMIMCLLIKGSENANQYGEPPAPVVTTRNL